MVTTGLEPEVVEIFRHVNEGNNFLLSGGAGSGKTYSLVQVIRKAFAEFPTDKIACMTYTNAAAKEIENRIQHPNLFVSTIHDFLWENIKGFQKELKKGLIELINDENSKTKLSSQISVATNFFDSLELGIQYKEYQNLAEGIISHDQVLEIAHFLFKNYPLLSDIIKDRYKFILIDEYQDTHEFVIEIFLTHLKQSSRKNIVGFFGDAMQSIYDTGVGNIQKYIDEGAVFEVQKTQNRRNPQSVIDLANRLRKDVDGIIQKPSSDIGAPNMENGIVKKGSVKFLFSAFDYEGIPTEHPVFQGWEIDNPKDTKQLFLTHNLISGKAGYPTLMEIYDKDPVIGLKSDLVSKIKKNEIEIADDDTFENVVDRLELRNRQRQLKIDLIKENPKWAEAYSELKDLPFSIVRKIYIDKDALIDDKKTELDKIGGKGAKRDNLIQQLFKIQSLIFLYETKSYNEFLRRTELKIHRQADKKEIQKKIQAITAMQDAPISEVIDFADTEGLVKKGDSYKRFIDRNQYLFNRVKSVPFREFQNLYSFLEGHTPFSTQHKTKGSEYPNVLMVLDNGNWNSYNFRDFFSGKGTASVLERTIKIFYVCCTRAMENLVLFYNNATPEVIEGAKKLFGEQQVIEVE